VRNNKAPGTDNIHIKPYKKGGQLLINMLHSLIKRMWTEEKVPTEWKTNIIVPICKKKKRVTNYSNTIIQEYHYYAQDQNTNHSYQKTDFKNRLITHSANTKQDLE
jgi:hypothetical protein